MSSRKSGRTGPGALTASVEARKRMAVILETLSGVRTTQEAAEALGVAQARYYQLETYALEGLLSSLEPRKRGRQATAEQECERLRADVQRLEREVKRQQALYRTAQRVLGVPKAQPRTKAKTATGAKKKPTRRRRKETRGERIVKALSGDDPQCATPNAAGGES